MRIFCAGSEGRQFYDMRRGPWQEVLPQKGVQDRDPPERPPVGGAGLRDAGDLLRPAEQGRGVLSGTCGRSDAGGQIHFGSFYVMEAREMACRRDKSKVWLSGVLA